MGLGFSIIILILLIFIGWAGSYVPVFTGVFLPYAALLIFIVGIAARIIKWAKSPVPFRITTTSGQQKSLPWIHSNKLDNPSTALGVIGRMALEIFFFRSLFRNTKASIKDGKKLIYGSEKWLWGFGLMFHWSFLIIVLRHFRFFSEPIPSFVTLLQQLDGFFQVGVPVIYITDALILAALTFLFFRRIFNEKVKYISLSSDYFPLLLILGIGITGVLMRYFTKVDLIAVKQLAIGLFSFNPVVPAGIGAMFYIHLFLVSALLIYFPMSKLMHMPGVFMSPTRNLANNNRMQRHVNPWIGELKMHPHTYEEYEDEFRDVMKSVGLPLEKEEK